MEKGAGWIWGEGVQLAAGLTWLVPEPKPSKKKIQLGWVASARLGQMPHHNFRDPEGGGEDAADRSCLLEKGAGWLDPRLRLKKPPDI